MDLREYNPSPAQLNRARDLVIGGVMGYQPWIFADDFECGVGLEFSATTIAATFTCPIWFARRPSD